MLASYLARQYAMYAIANQYQHHNTNLVIPSVCFQSTSRVDTADTSTFNVGPYDGKSVTDTTRTDDHNRGNRRKQKSPEHKVMTSEIKFSIDRILGNDKDDDLSEPDEGVAESNEQIKVEHDEAQEYQVDEDMKFSWLNCTRYKPPKLQRIRKKGGGKKRKLGRNPRVPFSQQQVAALEQKFSRTHYLSSMDVAELSTALSLTETRVKIWFQNRRARERRDRDAKRRLCAELDQTRSPGHVVFPSSSSSGAPTSAWMNRADTTVTFTPYKDIVHAASSAFAPVSYSGTKS